MALYGDFFLQRSKRSIEESVLKDVVMFVDFGNMSPLMKRFVANEGIRVARTFSTKVTHVLFGNGRPSTISKAKERGIPLVNLHWFLYCNRFNQMLPIEDMFATYIIKERKEKERKKSNANKVKAVSLPTNEITVEEQPIDELIEDSDLFKCDDFQLLDYVSGSFDDMKNISYANENKFNTGRGFGRQIDMGYLSPETLTIACVGLNKMELKFLQQVIQYLGNCVLHFKVEPTTKYLITKQLMERKVKMMFAIAYGCYIISFNWALHSNEIGYWLPPDEYTFNEIPASIKEFRTLRQSPGGSLLNFNLFCCVGKIYISDYCYPSTKCLKRLVKICGGQLTDSVNFADIVIGLTLQMTNNNIKETWILDSVFNGQLLNINTYLIK